MFCQKYAKKSLISEYFIKMTNSTRSREISLVVSLVIITVYIGVANSQIIDCARLMMKVAKGLLRIYAQCSKEFMGALNGDQDEYIRRVDCVFKCVMDRVGLLDEVQKVTNDTMQVFFDKFIPEDYHEIGHIMVEGCIDEFSPLMENSIDDDTCNPYGDFVKCVQNIVASAC